MNAKMSITVKKNRKIVKNLKIKYFRYIKNVKYLKTYFTDNFKID